MSPFALLAAPPFLMAVFGPEALYSLSLASTAVIVLTGAVFGGDRRGPR